MDLNRKYSDHQRAVMQAAATGNKDARADHLGLASAIAGQIQSYQRKLGAAASCAWGTRPSGAPAAVAVKL